MLGPGSLSTLLSVHLHSRSECCLTLEAQIHGYRTELVEGHWLVRLPSNDYVALDTKLGSFRQYQGFVVSEASELKRRIFLRCWPKNQIHMDKRRHAPRRCKVGQYEDGIIQVAQTTDASIAHSSRGCFRHNGCCP